jgi:RimJ/RimL family protein N-acetyltransferase
VIVTGQPVVDWVYAATGGGTCRNALGIGDQRGQQLAAGVVLENWNGCNVMLHIRIDSPPVRSFWHELFAYIFVTAGCLRATAVIDSTNEKCLSLVKKLNFEPEATLRCAGRAGADAIVHVLWKANRRNFQKGLI